MIFLVFQHEIAEAGYLAQILFLQLTPKLDRSSEGVYKIMIATMDAKHIKLDSNLTKHLPIANHSLGLEFLAQATRHYDLCSDEPQMNQKIL